MTICHFRVLGSSPLLPNAFTTIHDEIHMGEECVSEILFALKGVSGDSSVRNALHWHQGCLGLKLVLRTVRNPFYNETMF